MTFIQAHWLTLILLLPLGGAVLVLLTPRDLKGVIRWGSFAWSLIPLGLVIGLWAQFNIQLGYQFTEQAAWFPQIGASYHLGVDGLSLPMVFLTVLLVPLAMLISMSIQDRVKEYFALFFLLETGILGVFLAMDLMLFFLFWEIGLIPMYFLISGWGGKNRDYASFKFFVYTMGGSLLMLLAIQLIGVVSGTFDIPTLLAQTDGPLGPFKTANIPFLNYDTVKILAFWAFTIAFAIKVPVWPFHTWLPDAHTEAPTGGSMMLAGVLLKLGAYGFLRLVLPFFPEQAAQFAPVLAVLGLLGVCLGSFSALGQTDFKRLVAYSSVGHMGFVVMGIAAVAAAWNGSSHLWNGYDLVSVSFSAGGAVLQMFTHGLSAAAMFALVGVIYDRAHTRDLNSFGGIWTVMPVYGSILVFSTMASLGLPGLSGFVSEYMVMRGVWPIFTGAAIFAIIGLILTGAYLLWMLQRVLHGPVNEKWAALPEIKPREVLAVLPLMVLMLLTGLYPGWIMNMINYAVVRIFGLWG